MHSQRRMVFDRYLHAEFQNRLTTIYHDHSLVNIFQAVGNWQLDDGGTSAQFDGVHFGCCGWSKTQVICDQVKISIWRRLLADDA